MEQKKIALSIIGLGALVVPVILLIIFANRSQEQPQISAGNRSIDPQTVQDVVRNIPSPDPIILPSPSPATVSAELDLEGSPSAE
ncbi:hypothetical protein A3J17_04035 [Candidatus Curtissbacteria bacterium RIFCSPLOWO2_02_FULL_40_11]|uniref:Uncharacterized protein n=2 Tax=Candidatus Curtissiibacteriota TaxID=1752717 RepID=A0A1F5G6F2_9BACT|nr:MAG: hypothetical protein A3D04_00010 [Candidatus Curtissbacteria bacterium RIFCSPHIGHO2_02_FULL_40_16b]OGE00696.1 MAG: hypothetical protein A3J17_04035 [Candidatus Curtissbacteria bacterium RIFCSPLOWO2_02_FULL_40_11]OGE12658.1 MAG: hypothetical protein A3G14_00270 [Candidatus Curtissbacteria bacterium RIFCSPLOWO2_12_FULL_38_9]